MKNQPQDKKVAQPFREIEKIQQKREQRRVKMEEAKKDKQEKKAYNIACGKNVDIDFQIMIQKNMFKDKLLSPHTSSSNLKLAVCVRKRPIFKKEQANGQIDSISCANPQIKIHEPKYRVDGITKYVQNHKFTFDNSFNEEQGTEDIYQHALKPLVPMLVNNGIVTCFAYGQTGSGKTFTMNGLQNLIVGQMFAVISSDYEVSVSFFEIYGGRCLDLLNNKEPLNIFEDQKNSIQIPDLTEKKAYSASQLLKIMAIANATRTTHATVANDTSSRSHAICQVLVKNSKDQQVGKLMLVDLAGSQRAGDTKSNNRQRRMEGAEINTSLLALKQCIRAMDEKADHIPFRASKLTLILRDSFTVKQSKSKIVMLACISPGSSSSDHSLNTLRYADRLKNNAEISKKYQYLDKQVNDKQKQNLRDEIKERIGSCKNIAPKNEEIGTPLQNGKTPKKSEKKVHIPTPTILSNNNSNNSNIVNNPNTDVIPSQKKIPTNLPKINKKEQIMPHAPTSVKKIQKSKSLRKLNDANQNDEQDVNKGTDQFTYKKSEKKGQRQTQIEEQIEVEDIGKNKHKPKKFKNDYNALKETMKGVENREELLAFTTQVAHVFEEQEQVFATHMAAIKQDARLLTQQSELISMIQGTGFIDYDIDNYVEKLELIMKRKMKVYALLTKKVQKLKKCLKQEDQMHNKVKDTPFC